MFISAAFEIKDFFDFRSENPLPNDLQRTLLEARQYNFVHDVIEEIAFVYVENKKECRLIDVLMEI